MADQKFIIHLTGRSCAGKSTLSKLLSQKFPDMFTVDYDHLKWQFGGYHRDQHKALVKDITLGLFEIVCSKSIPVQLDLFAYSQEEFDAIKQIAEKFGYKFTSIYLTAPNNILLERFRERVVSAKKAETKISITDENLFKSRLAEDYFVAKESHVFDTSKMDPNAILDQVLKLI